MGEELLGELREAGRTARDLLLPGCDWVHRRVQRVSYLEPSLLSVRLSVDFTPPAEGTGSHLPISVLPKWPPLYRFDYRRGDGRPVPLLTSAENGVADKALLESLVELVSPGSLAGDPALAKALSSLTMGPETHLEEASDAFYGRLGGDPNDPRRERVLELAAMLPDATLLWWPVGPQDLGRRTICKVEYLIRSLDSHRAPVRVLRSLSWRQPEEYIPLWHVGADANFHAEVEAPEVLTIRRAVPLMYRFEEGTPAPAERDQHVDTEGRLAHYYLAGRRPLAVDLVVTFAPARRVIAAIFGAAFLIALLVTGFFAWRTELDIPDHIEAAVAVLILVPALIGYVVVRPSDPPLARRYVFGAQLLSLIASAVPLVMAVLLLRYSADPGCLRTSWLWSMVASWVIAILLFVSLCGAGGPSD